MPARDSNASCLFLLAMITGAAVAALSEGNGGSTARYQDVSASERALYEPSENWRTSVRIYAAAK